MPISHDFVNCLGVAAKALRERKEEVNRLNVFPVPDGDTGTNMSLTMDMVVSELSKLPQGAPLSQIRKAISYGSLMGARGNSGVITSQILRGICDGLAGATSFDTDTVAKAMARGVEVSYQAVRKPVEGTILTVFRDASDAASQAAQDGMALEDALHFISDAAFASVRRTPELLPVLKENGVVDAGGFGLSILIEAFVGAVTGKEGFIPSASTISRPEPKVAIELINDWEGSAYRYCTEFLLFGDKIDKNEVAQFLTTMGDCDLIVGEVPNFKVHVHTNTPGTVLSYMTERGQVAEVHIHNMQLQSEDRNAKLEAETKDRKPSKPLGFVAVAAGQGMREILESLGVDYVVSGGQTMNPSTKDLLEAVDAVDAESVIIMPNNKNIIMAANAAASESSKPVAVVPTKAVPEAFTAMFAVDLEADMQTNVAAMTQALSGVKCGEVTTAIKDAKAADGTDIHEGDVIGIAGSAIVAVGRAVAQVTLDLLESMGADDYDTLTILAGEDIDDEAFQSIVSSVVEGYPCLEVDDHRGQQPLYPVVLSLE
ncbi:MAG: DAK2 domain-containing protein [Coriobacteriales bacterium]|nr:DAK2 domain-containing protein [Coriobacteriales bacterium]